MNYRHIYFEYIFNENKIPVNDLLLVNQVWMSNNEALTSTVIQMDMVLKNNILWLYYLTKYKSI